MNDEIIRTNNTSVLPSDLSNNNKQKVIIFCLFKEMIKEGAAKKGGPGSELIEEMMVIGEEMVKKSNIINIDNNLIKAINEFVKIAKENGFKEDDKYKKIIITDIIVYKWLEFCEEV